MTLRKSDAYLLDYAAQPGGTFASRSEQSAMNRLTWKGLATGKPILVATEAGREWLRVNAGLLKGWRDEDAKARGAA